MQRIACRMQQRENNSAVNEDAHDQSTGRHRPWIRRIQATVVGAREGAASDASLTEYTRTSNLNFSIVLVTAVSAAVASGGAVASDTGRGGGGGGADAFSTDGSAAATADAEEEMMVAAVCCCSSISSRTATARVALMFHSFKSTTTFGWREERNRVEVDENERTRAADRQNKP